MANKILVQQLRSKLTYDTGNAKLPNSTDFNENTQYKYGTLALNYLKGQEAMTTLNDENQVVAFNYNLNLTSNSTTVEEQVYEIVKTAKSITVNNEWLITHRIINEGIITLLGGCFNENKIEYIKVVINEDRKCTKEVSNFEFNFGAVDIDFQYNMSNQNVTNVDEALRELYQEINDIITNPISFVEGDGIVVSGEGTEKTISTNVKLDIKTIEGKEMIQLLDATDNSKVLAEVDASKFVVDGMLNSAEIISVTDETELPEGVELSNGKYIKLTWNTDAVKTDTYIPVADLISEHKVVAGEDVAGEFVVVATNVVESTDENGIKVSTVNVTVDDSAVKSALNKKIGKDDVMLSFGGKNETYVLNRSTSETPVVLTGSSWRVEFECDHTYFDIVLKNSKGEDVISYSGTVMYGTMGYMQHDNGVLTSDVFENPNERQIDPNESYSIELIGSTHQYYEEQVTLTVKVKSNESQQVFNTEESIQYLNENKADKVFVEEHTKNTDLHVTQALQEKWNNSVEKSHEHSNITELNKIILGDISKYVINNKNFNEEKDENDEIISFNMELSANDIPLDENLNLYDVVKILTTRILGLKMSNMSDVVSDVNQNLYECVTCGLLESVDDVENLSEGVVFEYNNACNEYMEQMLTFIESENSDGGELEVLVQKMSVFGEKRDILLNTIKDKKIAKELNWNDAVNKSHTHLNKTEIDNINVGDVNKWNEYVNTLKISVEEQGSNNEDTIFKQYIIKQGNEEVKTINIPKDLVVESGEVIVATEEDKNLIKGDTYLKLILNSSTANPIYIAVKDLVDVYTADEKYIHLGVDNKFSLDLQQINDDLLIDNINQQINNVSNKADNTQTKLNALESVVTEFTEDCNMRITAINENIAEVQNDKANKSEIESSLSLKADKTELDTKIGKDDIMLDNKQVIILNDEENFHFDYTFEYLSDNWELSFKTYRNYNYDVISIDCVDGELIISTNEETKDKLKIVCNNGVISVYKDNELQPETAIFAPGQLSLAFGGAFVGEITLQEGLPLNTKSSLEYLNKNKADKSEVYTKDEINEKGYLTEHQDISHLATKDEVIKNEEVVANAFYQIKDSIGLNENGYFTIKEESTTVKNAIEKLDINFEQHKNNVNDFININTVEPYIDLKNVSTRFTYMVYSVIEDNESIDFVLPNTLKYNEYHYIIYNNGETDLTVMFDSTNIENGVVTLLSGNSIVISPKSYGEINVAIVYVSGDAEINIAFIRAIV